VRDDALYVLISTNAAPDLEHFWRVQVDHSSLAPKPEANFLDMYPGMRRIYPRFGVLKAPRSRLRHVGVPSQRSDQKIVAEGSGEAGKQRNVQRLDAVDVEGVDVFGVVGVGHGATLGGSHPLVLFAERDLVADPMHGSVGFQQPSLCRFGNRSQRNGRLAVRQTRGRVEEEDLIDVRERGGQRGRIPGSRGRTLKLTKGRLLGYRLLG